MQRRSFENGRLQSDNLDLLAKKWTSTIIGTVKARDLVDTHLDESHCASGRVDQAAKL